MTTPATLPMNREEAKARLLAYNAQRIETARIDFEDDPRGGPNRVEVGRRVHVVFESYDGSCPSDRDLDAFRMLELERCDTAVVVRRGACEVVVNTYMQSKPR